MRVVLLSHADQISSQTLLFLCLYAFMFLSLGRKVVSVCFCKRRDHTLQISKVDGVISSSD